MLSSTSGGEQVSPLLLTSSFSNELQHDGDEEEEEETDEERQVPPFRSLILEPLQLWCKRLQKPILLILLNLILTTLACVTIGHTVYAVMTWYDYSELHPKAGQHKKEVELKTLASVGFTILLLTFAMDAYVCLHAARDLEQKAFSSLPGSGQAQDPVPDEPSSSSSSSSMETSSQQGVVEGTPLPPTASDNEKEEEEAPYDFVSLSRLIDCLFGCGDASSGSTFLVGLLYALFALAVWMFVVGIASVAYIQMVSDLREGDVAGCLARPFTRYPTRQYRVSSDENNDAGTAQLKISWLATQHPALQSIPLEVIAWLQSDGKMYPSNYGPRQKNSSSSSSSSHASEGGSYQRGLPYVQAMDGSTAFPFRRRNNDRNFDNQVVDRGVVLVTTTANGTATTVEFAMNNTFFATDTYEEGPVQLVGIPNQPPYQGWCGISGNSEARVLQQEVICYNGAAAGQQQQQVKQFPGKKHPRGKTHFSSFSDPRPIFYALDETLWLAVDHHWSVRQSDGDKETDMAYVSLTSYNIATMERKVIVEMERNKTHANHHHHHSYDPVYPLTLQFKCHHSHGVLLLVSVPALCLLSFYLYRQDVPSSFVPLGLALFLVTSSVLPWIWPWVVDMSIATLILCLLAFTKDGPCQVIAWLWKFISMEMLLWLQYSLLACHFVAIGIELINIKLYHLREGGSSFISVFILVPAVTCMVTAANALILNHPVMEVFGIGVVVLCLCSIPILVAYAPIYILPLPILFSCALSSCCMGAGRIVRQFRLYLVVYCRRGCRALRKKRHGGCC